MKKKSIRKSALGVLLLTALAFTAVGGCGTSGSGYEASADMAASVTAEASGGAFDGGIYESAAIAEDAKAEEEYGETDAAETVQDQSRKLIKNVDLSVETEEFDLLLSNVEQKVAELGGYVEQSNVYNGSYTSDYRSRSADITARIPAQKLDQFVTDVAEQSNVTRRSESVEDVTLQYVDLESHKKALQAEQESLLSMLEQAESIEDIIAINEQLTDVRYRIESMESQLRTYDNKITYSTVYLYVEEVEQYEPYAAKSTSERIGEGFMRNLRRVGNGIANFFIELVIALPLIVTAAVVIGLLALLVFVLCKAGEKRAAKRREKMAAKNPGRYDRYGVRKTQENLSARYRAGSPAEPYRNGAMPQNGQTAQNSQTTQDGAGGRTAQDGGDVSKPASDVSRNGKEPS